MITIAGLVWDNWFSYGDGNFLDTQESKVTQITGNNGTGKSSIPVIVGEILYGKNNLGKAKGKLFNRYLDKKHISANLIFYVDEDKYSVVYDRKSTLKLALYKNEEDISSHTATETYKSIANILGYDFNTFWGLIYQSSKDGLEFLTATDTARKKFLVKLFNLSEYIVIHEFFKNEANEKNTEMLIKKGKLDTVYSWIETNEKIDLTEKPILLLPNIDKKDIDKLGNLKAKLENIHENNKKINLNEQLKSILMNLNTDILNETIQLPDIEHITKRLEELNKQAAINNSNIKTYNDKINKIKKIGDICPSCTQEVGIDFKDDYITDKKVSIEALEIKNTNIDIEYKDLLNIKNTALASYAKKSEQDKTRKELQDLLSKIDNDLPTEVYQEQDILDEINEISSKIQNIEQEIKTISGQNLIAEAHNSKIKVIKEQLDEYRLSADELDKEIDKEEQIITDLNIIKKAFSTNGLISYKIENLSKELENQINIYLAELSKGRFQLKFTISGEKLNIDIIDDGNTIGVEELSAGELARVNTATLLAIRKLMAAISSNKINILFLDEITGVLDEEGKEVLIDILNNETELNTFLVSHEFTHPLIPQINVIKENKISKIEE